MGGLFNLIFALGVFFVRIYCINVKNVSKLEQKEKREKRHFQVFNLEYYIVVILDGMYNIVDIIVHCVRYKMRPSLLINHI